jgi:hypothetical protein
VEAPEGWAMSKKSVTVIKKNDPGYGMGQQTQAPVTKSPTVPQQNAQVLQPPPIPKAPPLPTSTDPVMGRIKAMGGYLDRSEGRAGPSGTSTSVKNPPAHARAEHSGRTGPQLESRGKDKDGAFMTPYDQNKALAMMLGTSDGQAAQNTAKTQKGEVVETDMPKPKSKDARACKYTCKHQRKRNHKRNHNHKHTDTRAQSQSQSQAQSHSHHKHNSQSQAQAQPQARPQAQA